MTPHAQHARSTGRLAAAALLLTAGILVAPGAMAQANSPADAPAAQTPEQEPVRTIEHWNLPKKSRLAIKGYDPVAYFPEGGERAEKGKDTLEYEHRGVRYRFVNADNLERFKANPSRYEPAHGGWCSYAMIDGEKTEPDPRKFIVKDNRVFLFYDGFGGDTKAKWLRNDHAAQARSADDQWKKISGESPRAVPPKQNAPE